MRYNKRVIKRIPKRIFEPRRTSHGDKRLSETVSYTDDIQPHKLSLLLAGVGSGKNFFVNQLIKGYEDTRHDGSNQCMVGDFHEVYQAKDIFLEGPHIFKKDGWYYLFCADTGTGELHGQTMLRSRHIFGPYEMNRPDFGNRTLPNEAYSLLTSRPVPEHPIQKAGHCDLVETQNGDWYIVHLCGRPLDRCNPPDAPRFAGARRYLLGRETAIQRVYWTEDGWLRLLNGSNTPDETLPEANLPPQPWPPISPRDDFDAPALDIRWQTLRTPLTEKDFSLSARPGYLRLYGGNGLGSRFTQSLIAQRITEHSGLIETCVEFEPAYYKQM